MNKKAMIDNAESTIRYQEKLAKAGKDFSPAEVMQAERMIEVAGIRFERSEREQLKSLAMLPNPDWQTVKGIKEKYSLSWNELKAMAMTCTESEIKQIREMSGLTRNDFAVKYRIPIRTLEKWERSEITPADYLVEWLERLVRIDFENP